MSLTSILSFLCSFSKSDYSFTPYLMTFSQKCFEELMWSWWACHSYVSGLICVSLSEFVVVEVQLGGEVSLLCSNLSNIISNIFWFKSAKRSNTTRIASMPTAESNATVLEDFKNGRFHMSSNTTHVFLNIKEFNISDSGLYFCGLNTINYNFDATFLQVKGKIYFSFFQSIKSNTFTKSEFCAEICLLVSSSETPAFNLVVGILGSVIIVLVMVIIFLLVKIKTFQKGTEMFWQIEMKNQMKLCLNLWQTQSLSVV